MDRLATVGVVSAAIDITMMGSTGVTVLQWYAGIIKGLASSFKLPDFQVSDWLKQHSYLSPVQCLNEFIESILLVRVEQNIVIFIDEIDSVLGLEFSLDDFFALIRSVYNKRVDNPDFQRLTFCLLGVTTPGDLIADKSLSNLDYQFLNTSQEVERREAQKTRKLQQESNARKTAQVKMVLAIISTAIASSVALTTNNLRLQASRSQIKSEREELTALVQTSEALFESDRQFEALIKGVKANNIFKF